MAERLLPAEDEVYMAQPQPCDQAQIEIIVPSGALPGQLLGVVTPAGHQVQVTIPAGAAPGATFWAFLPPTPPQQLVNVAPYSEHMQRGAVLLAPQDRDAISQYFSTKWQIEPWAPTPHGAPGACRRRLTQPNARPTSTLTMTPLPNQPPTAAACTVLGHWQTRSSTWGKRCCLVCCPVTFAIMAAFTVLQALLACFTLPLNQPGPTCAGCPDCCLDCTSCGRDGGQAAIHCCADTPCSTPCCTCVGGGAPVWFRNGGVDWVYRAQDGSFFDAEGNPMDVLNPGFDSCCGTKGDTVGVNGPVEWENHGVIAKAHKYVYDKNNRRTWGEFCTIS